MANLMKMKLATASWLQRLTSHGNNGAHAPRLAEEEFDHEYVLTTVVMMMTLQPRDATRRCAPTGPDGLHGHHAQ